MKLPVCILGLVVLLGGACGFLSARFVVQEKATDWPQFRGPEGQGISRDKGLVLNWSQKQNLVWKTSLPGGGASTPIILGDRVFVSCYSGFGVRGQKGDKNELKLYIACLDRADGKIRWSKEVEPKLPATPISRADHGYASSTPTADSEQVYFFFGNAGVFAFDHEGRQRWRADVGSDTHEWGSATSLLLYGDLLIVNASVESKSLVALDKKTGKEVWRAKGIRESWNTPVLVQVEGGKTELVVASQGKVLAFEPTTGESLWSCATEITWYMVPSLVAQDGVVYCIGGRTGVAALAVRAGGRGDVTKSRRLWKSNKGSNVSSPIIHDGHLYWMSDSIGVAYCAEAKTGNIVYEERVAGAGEIYSAAVLADGKLHYVSRDGRTFVLPAHPKYERLAMNELRDGSTFNSSLAVAGGRLFLRSDRFLYCIGNN